MSVSAPKDTAKRPGLATIRAAASSDAEQPGSPSLEGLIWRAVRQVLEEPDLGLDGVDAVVSVGSDQIDGGISPLLLCEAAGALGRDYMHFTGSSGEALQGAIAALTSGLAESVLVVGWGVAPAAHLREIGAYATDPVLHRTLGVGADELALLQVSWLEGRKRIVRASVDAYAAEMRRRGGAGKARPHHGADQPDALDDEIPMPAGAERATAIVLERSGAQFHESRRPGGIRITDLRSSCRPLVPPPQEWDPGRWVADLVHALGRDGFVFGPETEIEITARTAHCELRAVEAIEPGGDWRQRAGLNRSGGGLAGYNGPADGLKRLENLWRLMRDAPSSHGTGLMIEMAGPMGQAVTAVALEAEP